MFSFNSTWSYNIKLLAFTIVKFKKNNFCSFFRKLLSSPCGESPTVISYVTIAFGGLLLWTLLFAILGEEVEPGGQLFILIVLMLLSCLSGWLISLLHLPPLLGMLLCGIVLRNTGFFDVGGVYLEIISVIRYVFFLYFEEWVYRLAFDFYSIQWLRMLYYSEIAFYHIWYL